MSKAKPTADQIQTAIIKVFNELKFPHGKEKKTLQELSVLFGTGHPTASPGQVQNSFMASKKEFVYWSLLRTIVKPEIDIESEYKLARQNLLGTVTRYLDGNAPQEGETSKNASQIIVEKLEAGIDRAVSKLTGIKLG